MASIKECFKSRWGSDGVIMECDFSQLEVIGAAYVTGDEALKEDLRAGLDMHCVNAEFMFGRPYQDIRDGYLAGDKVSTKQRSMAKAKGFLIFYGGTAFGMSQGFALTQEECQVFIDNFFKKYPDVLKFQDMMYNNLQSYEYPTDNMVEVNGKNYREHYAVWESCTGRKYQWQQYPNKGKAGYKGWKPLKYNRPQVCNYPVQGFATGDIVPEMLGRVVRALFKYNLYDKCLPINTIHDSIIFDVHKDNLPTSTRVVQKVMQAAPLAMEKRFGLKLSLPFNVDVEVGDSWDEMKGYAV
jgi:DNA polymerase I-like protein with 3'-5' exonuclease and polymerase domains